MPISDFAIHIKKGWSMPKYGILILQYQKHETCEIQFGKQMK